MEGLILAAQEQPLAIISKQKFRRPVTTANVIGLTLSLA